MDKLGNLSNNYVNDIAQDSLGLIWVATTDGLCRYDDEDEIKVFKKGDIGLESDIIRTLETGSDQSLWIGTTFGGITRYNVLSNTSVTYTTDDRRKTRLSNSEVLSAAEVSPSEIWVGTEDGLDVIYPEQDSIFNFNVIKDQLGIKGAAILDIYVDQNDWIWITTWNKGTYLYLPHHTGVHSKGTFRKISMPDLESKSNVWKIIQADKDHYWLATHNGGLVYMQLPTNASNKISDQHWTPKFKNYTTAQTNLALDYLRAIEFDSDENLWIGTNRGISILTADEIKSIDFSDPSQKVNFKSFFQQPRLKYGINDNNITSLFLDKQGLLWIGSTSGINQYNKSNNRFSRTLLSDFFIGANGKNDRVNSIKILDSTTIILGTSENGILCYDLEKGKLIDHPILENGFPNERITSLYKYKNEAIYKGTVDGVCRVSLNPPYGITQFPFDHNTLLSSREDSNSEPPPFRITAVLKDSQGRLWAGSENDLYLIDESTNEWIGIKIDDSVTHLLEDSDKNIWATTYRGITRINNKKNVNSFDHYLRGDSNAGDIMLSNQIITVKEHDKILYFGAINGMFTYNLRTQKFERLENSSKYAINSLAITEEGIIWSSTPNGIIRYNISQKKEKLYTEKDGLQMTSFRADAILDGLNGDVFFGCQEGFVQLNENLWEPHNMMPTVYITDVTTSNSDSSEFVNGINSSTIILDPDNISVSIKYTSNNYSQPNFNQYAYRLEGFDGEDWNITDKEEITYTNLDPGDYTFTVKSSCLAGIWSEHHTSISLDVQPSFHETYIYKALVLLGSASLMLAIIYFYTRMVKRRNTILNDYNKRLNLQIHKTESANKSLADREQKMQELVNKLDESNKELKRSNKDLEQFAYIASHDLQEPLRTVSAFVDILGKKSEKGLDEENKQITSYIQQGVDRMSSLIHSLLIFSLIGKEGHQFEEVDLNIVVNEKVHDLARYIKEHNADVLISSLPSIVCRKEEIATVFYNLILNGIKFNKSDAPSVTINCQELENHWEFQVTDNGIGIPKNYQEQIFEIFKRLHGKGEYEGTGIGLSVCNKIINKHHGLLTVDSQEGRGSTFTFTIDKHLEAAVTELELA